MGRGRVAGDGIGARKMARNSLRRVAGGLRARQSACRRRVLDDLPALGLAADVLHRWIARAADALHSREGEGERRVEGDRRCAHKLGRLFPRRRRQREALPLPGAADGRAEFHVARHAGSLPDVPPAPTPFRSAHNGDRQRGLDAGCNCGRNCGRALLRSPRQASRDDHVFLSWRFSWSRCGFLGRVSLH